MVYRSPLPYAAGRVRAALLCCSDGRIGAHIDEFARNGLGLELHDRVAVPGGPACLAGHEEAHVSRAGVLGGLEFLIEAHGLERVVLLQHQGCAFYAQRVGVDAERMAALQRADLVRAALEIRRMSNQIEVEAFYARYDGARVDFEPVGTA